MGRMLGVPLALALLVMAGEARSAMTVADFREVCAAVRHTQDRISRDDPMNSLSGAKAMVCIGMIRGFLGGARMGIFFDDMRRQIVASGGKKVPKTPKVIMPFCHPAGVTFSQMAQVFVKWADKNPEVLNDPWRYGLSETFFDTWPCSKWRGK